MTTASASSCMGRKRRTGSKRQAALPDQCTPFRANISTKYPSRGVFLPSHRSVQSSVQSIRHGAYFYRHTVPCKHQYNVSLTGRMVYRHTVPCEHQCKGSVTGCTFYRHTVPCKYSCKVSVTGHLFYRRTVPCKHSCKGSVTGRIFYRRTTPCKRVDCPEDCVSGENTASQPVT